MVAAKSASGTSVALDVALVPLNHLADVDDPPLVGELHGIDNRDLEERSRVRHQIASASAGQATALPVTAPWRTL